MEFLSSLFSLPPGQVLALVSVAFCAGIVDAIAGGGGLLNVPALMLAGLDPVSAVATNKLQGTFGVLASTRAYARAGLINVRDMAQAVAGSAIGAGLGAISAQVIPTGALRTVVPFLLLALALFIALSPKLTDAESHRRLGRSGFALGAASVIGFYDGIFGPGGGTFFFIALVLLLGQGVTRAAANAKLLNLASNAGAFALFALSGHIVWALGVSMGLAAMAGSAIGARAALKQGAKLIKPLVIVVSIGMALRLMLVSSHPVGAWLGPRLAPWFAPWLAQ